jgi:hypothetical protein
LPTENAVSFTLLNAFEHVTGRNYNPRHDRNYVLVGKGSRDLEVCRSLTERGFMRGGQEIGWCANASHFTVTEAGEREYLRLRPPPKLTRSQQRYEQYLREDSGMKFGEWLKCQAYKREVAW